MTDRHPFLLTVEETARQLNTNIETGLTARQVAEIQKTYPPNELDTGGGTPWYKILGKQISNAMILVSSTYIKLFINLLCSALLTLCRFLYLPWVSVMELEILLKAVY